MLLTSLLLATQAFAPERAVAQAMMEYGGLMAMPKGVPSGNSVNMLTNPYRSIGNKFPGGNTSSSAEAPGATPTQVTNSSPATSIDALGTVTIDPKKVQILGAQALKQYEQAKAKMIAKPQDLKGAEVTLREAINTRNSIWGYDDPMMPAMLTLMGEIYAKQKHASESEACYKNALVYITKKQGSGSFERLDTLAKLGALYNDNGNHKDALPCFQQVAQIKERQFGASSLAALKARLQWANTSSAVGKADTDFIYKGLLANLDQSDKTKAGYKELQTEFIKSYGAFLSKEGKSEEANALASHFASAGAEEEVGKKADTDKSPVANTSTSAASNSSALNKPTAAVDEPQAKPETQAKASDSSSSIGTMTMEQMLNAEASNKKKSKGKSNE
jgi:tetratricopeptide (TPR) repeat protein